MALQLVHVRCDDRLIHGQGLAWLKSLPINMVVVVNDGVAGNTLEQDLMATLVPSSTDLRFFSVQKAIDTLPKAADRQKIFLLFKDLKDVQTVFDGGIDFKHLNIGNIRRKNNTTKITPYVNLTEDEMKVLKDLKSKGMKFDSKQTPMGEARGETIDFKTLLK